MSHPEDPGLPDDKRVQITIAVAKAIESVYGEGNKVACVVVWSAEGPVHMTSNLPVFPLIQMLSEAIMRVSSGPAAGRVEEPTAPPRKPS